jgi:hypothetical protein
MNSLALTRRIRRSPKELRIGPMRANAFEENEGDSNESP